MINYYGILAIYNFEMARAIRTIGQSVASPVISTALYFVVFGSTIGNPVLVILIIYIMELSLFRD